MKLPRLTLSGLMAAIAILAINFGAIRALSETPGISIGVLPMGNILGLTYLGLRRRPASRAFLLGFELFGLIALLSYIPFMTAYDRQIIEHYIIPIRWPIEALMGHQRGVPTIAAVFPVVLLAIVLPLLSFAYLGGYLCRRYRAILYRTFPALDAPRPPIPPAGPA